MLVTQGSNTNQLLVSTTGSRINPAIALVPVIKLEMCPHGKTIPNNHTIGSRKGSIPEMAEFKTLVKEGVW